MTRYRWHGLVGGLIAFALFSPPDANAKGIILITHGETIDHIGDVPAGIEKSQGINKVGYKYGYWGVFWINLWTHSGTYCIYEGDRYSPIPAAEAARLLRMRQADLGAPFLYNVPLGWMLIGPLIVVGLVMNIHEKRKVDPISRLFQDHRYQKALEIVAAEYDKQAAEATPATGPEGQAGAGEKKDFQAAFEVGIKYLTGIGIPREEAERNLSTMIQIYIQSQQQAGAAPGGS